MMSGKGNFAFAGEGEIGVVLNTDITPELKEEGYLREILSKVQNMRKESNFEVMDKIHLYIAGNEKLEELVKKNEEDIKKETLSLDVNYNVANKEYTEVSINDEKLQITVEKE